ncbi:39S ribosomal protein L35, mitochondrial [Chelonus insularis]|uniref:39S ribosomal protein L35, mitochondrial n=1 Tax=Chelonus insularis TaxID=460826 RepID=UPI0015883D2A|nr:39S ribosomal protein L35, mitochondrial [Chelonus insularis]
MLTQIFRTIFRNGYSYGSKISCNLTGKVFQQLRTVTPQCHSQNLITPNRSFMSKPILSCSILTQITNKPCALSTPLTSINTNLNNVQNPPVRTLVKFTRHNGKRVSNPDVLERFYRLNWGIWIRTRAGRHKRLWKKRASRIVRSRQHVFCNSTQSYTLDKMVTKKWRKPTYFVDDPYNPYHQREEFWVTRTKPLP